MIARETLSYEPKPLPDRMQRSDEEMIAAANAHLAIMRHAIPCVISIRGRCHAA